SDDGSRTRRPRQHARAARGVVRQPATSRSRHRSRSWGPRVARNPVQARAGGAMTLRVLIADDEPIARRPGRRPLRADPDVAVVGECADGASAVQSMLADRPHLAFLDVQMPELDGFDVIAAVPPMDRPGVVFITAFDRYALRAFDVHAIDYLLKP